MVNLDKQNISKRDYLLVFSNPALFKLNIPWTSFLAITKIYSLDPNPTCTSYIDFHHNHLSTSRNPYDKRIIQTITHENNQHKRSINHFPFPSYPLPPPNNRDISQPKRQHE